MPHHTRAVRRPQRWQCLSGSGSSQQPFRTRWPSSAQSISTPACRRRLPSPNARRWSFVRRQESAPTIRNLIAILALLLSVFLSLRTPLAHAADDYKLGEDSQRHADVPQGEVTKYHWKSKVYPGTERDYWV